MIKRFFLKLIPLVSIFLTSCAANHQILGTTYGWDADKVQIIADIRVSDLRVRHVRLKNSDCANGFTEHLELSGPIGPDSSEVLERLLLRLEKCNSKSSGKNIVNSIYLNSNGGYLKDGFKMGEIFRKYSVQTIITGRQSCASACSVAFLGGRFRSMYADGLLIFHSPYFDTGIGIDCADYGQVNQLKNYFTDKLGTQNGAYLHTRTMSFCSKSKGWTLNSDAAKLFGITTD
jgi:hypothetical protein